MTERKSITEELLAITQDREQIIKVAQADAKIQLDNPNLSETYKNAVRKVTGEIIYDIIKIITI